MANKTQTMNKAKNAKQLKPSDFKGFPMASVLQNCESEIVACNIMTILKRTGDEFRELTIDEYVKERNKDKEKYSKREEDYFDNVKGYFKSADTAVLFSPVWKEESTK